MIKVVVLYPHPADPQAFERQYLEDHLPLMRRLLGDDVPLPTFKPESSPQRPAPYYRMAEIHFRDRSQLAEFVSSGKAAIGGESSESVSTGGKPVVLVCEERSEA
jgi:uncharacterized protein (TIGR02118 family)